MSLREEQSKFTRDFQKLIAYLINAGYEVTMGEVHRPPQMQKIYVSLGKSKVKISQHQKKLAGDLYIFLEGVLLEDRETLKPIGDFWESLDEHNRWGGSWRGKIERGESNFVDTPHFERYV